MEKQSIHPETYNIMLANLSGAFLFDVGIFQVDMSVAGEKWELPEAPACLPLVGSVNNGVSFMKIAAGYFSRLPLGDERRTRFASWGIFN